jgi:hypothetical protein
MLASTLAETQAKLSSLSQAQHGVVTAQQEELLIAKIRYDNKERALLAELEAVIVCCCLLACPCLIQRHLALWAAGSQEGAGTRGFSAAATATR